MQLVLEHLNQAGYELDSVTPDSQLHRFKRTGSDKKKTAWYVCHMAHSRRGHNFYIVIYGDWREGGSHKFNTLQDAQADDLSYIHAQVESAKKKQAEEQKRVWEEAALEAQAEWDAASIEGASKYLEAKQVKPYSIRFSEAGILVPCRDLAGKLWSFQRITSLGKYFYPAAKTKGMFHLIGPKPEKGQDVALVEGYATGASIHEATGLTVIVAFNASNLPEVSRQFPDLNIIICGDDDQFKPENAGRIWSAKCGAAKVIFPKFVDLEGQPTDFNDLACREGLQEVKHQILEDESERQFVIALGHKDETYYYTSSSNRQIVKIPRSGHNKANLMDLMPLEYWEALYPHPKGGANFDLAQNALMQRARARGIFDANNVRGVGVWKDDSRFLVNLGDGLYYNSRRHTLDSLKSSYIYEIGQRIPEPYLANIDLSVLPSLIETISFKHRADAVYMLGWLTVAPVAGALDWRPHVWLTGGAGTGKTTVMRTIDKFFGRNRHYFQGQTTEAGLRQTTSNGSLPVIFDEFESSDEKSSERIQQVLELMRQASSESEAHVAKGSAGGHAIAARPKFSALVSSIRVNLPNEADRSRFKEIELVRGTDAAFQEFKKYEALVTPEFSAAYFSRTFRLLPVLQENVDVFWGVLRQKFSARVGQQLGALLAGAWLAKNDVAVTKEEAEEFVASLNTEEAEQTTNVKDEVECIDHLASSIIRLDHGASRTVSELVEEGPDSVLQRHGMKIDDGFLCIASKHSGLTPLFKGTRWADKWGRSLIRLEGAVGKAVRIGGKTMYCAKVPLRFVTEATSSPI